MWSHEEDEEDEEEQDEERVRKECASSPQVAFFFSLQPSLIFSYFFIFLYFL